MRRTTRWAVFTSMNQPPPASRPPLEPLAGAEQDQARDGEEPSGSELQSRSTHDTRRDRVDFM